MALIPKDRYPGGSIDGDAGYPHGRARNISQPGDGTGYPWEQDGINDTLGFQQALLAAAGITPTGSPDSVGASQYLDALKALFGRPTCTVILTTAGPSHDEFFDLAMDKETPDSGYVVQSLSPSDGHMVLPPSAGHYLVTLTGTFLYDPFTSPPTNLDLRIYGASQAGIDVLDLRMTNVDQRTIMFAGTKLFYVNTVSPAAAFGVQNRSANPVLPVSDPRLTITKVAPNS